jgi:hypothetical protein
MEYVSLVLLQINGHDCDDFESVTEPEEVAREIVELMNKTGTCKVTRPMVVKVDYVKPLGASEFDFEQCDGTGTLIIDYQDGSRRSYRGVSFLKKGEMQFDGKKPGKRTIELLAQKVVSQ